jgi:hypothetical protein
MPTAPPAVSVAAMAAPLRLLHRSRYARLELIQVTGTHLATIARQALTSHTLATTTALIAQLAPTSLIKVKPAVSIARQALTSHTLATTTALIAQLAPTSLIKVKPAVSIAHQVPISNMKVVLHAPLVLPAKRLPKARRPAIKSLVLLVGTFHPAAATCARQARTPAQEPPAAVHARVELTAVMGKRRAPIVLLECIRAQADPEAACNVGQARTAAADNLHALLVLLELTVKTSVLLR